MLASGYTAGEVLFVHTSLEADDIQAALHLAAVILDSKFQDLLRVPGLHLPPVLLPQLVLERNTDEDC